MEPTNKTSPPNPETLFVDLLTASISEASDSGQIVSSPHEAYALLVEKLDTFWREVRNRRDPEVLLDHLVAIATQCATAADDLFVRQVLADNDTQEAK
jgi:hypothetical protein